MQSLRCLTLPARTKCHTLPEHYHHSLSTNPLSLRIRSLHIPVKSSQSLQRVCSGSSSGLPPHCRAPLTWQWRACYCSSLSEGDLRKKVEEITALFFEARELLDDAVRPCSAQSFRVDLYLHEMIVLHTYCNFTLALYTNYIQTHEENVNDQKAVFLVYFGE